MALLSLMGLYQYDNSMFDLLELPVEISKDDLVDNLLMETAELEVLYTNPEWMKRAIGAWSRKEVGVWIKLAATLNLDYNPIENYNRTDTHSETEHRDKDYESGETLDREREEKELRNEDLSSNGNADTTRNGTDTLRSYKGGYNDVQPLLYEEEQTIAGINTKIENIETGTRSEDRNIEHSENERVEREANEQETVTRSYTTNSKGNIGVTSTQDLIKQEREVALYNLYDYIISSFKKRFCILVY